MRSVDTNALVRLIMRDIPLQAESADAFISTGAWVSVVVLVEASWVLARVYKLDPRALAVGIGMLLEHDDLSLQDSEAVAAALELFGTKPALGFPDCMILELARRSGHLPLGTFDRALSKVTGAHKL